MLIRTPLQIRAQRAKNFGLFGVLQGKTTKIVSKKLRVNKDPPPNSDSQDLMKMGIPLLSGGPYLQQARSHCVLAIPFPQLVEERKNLFCDQHNSSRENI